MLEIIKTGQTDKLKNLIHGQPFMFKEVTFSSVDHRKHGILYMLSDEQSYIDLTDDVGALYPILSDIENIEVDLYNIVKIQVQRET